VDLNRLERDSEFRWRIAVKAPMNVPGILYGDREQILQMDDKVYEQLRDVTRPRWSRVCDAGRTLGLWISHRWCRGI
jgi:hypothetical protein